MQTKIKLLSDDLVNQIAAGEIVERPSSALKELIENSIDANSKNIEVFIQNGGKSKIVIQDDGDGLSKDDLLMAIQRHATSKLSDDNLFDIRTFGFRGEALPSIAAVSDFSMESNSFGISVNYSKQSGIFPSLIEKGTRVTVENLFKKMPARLKFLKSDSIELTSCIDIIENIALTKPDINFLLRSEDKQILSFKNDSIEYRVSKIFGEKAFEKAIHFEEKEDKVSVYGYLFHPMDSKYSQSFQRFFINNRTVKDKAISLSLRNAYKDLIPAGRFAMALLFVEIDPFYVDVNVSPTKSEIRFRDMAFIQKFITSSIKKNLNKFDRISNPFDIAIISQNSNLSKIHSSDITVRDKEPLSKLVENNFSKPLQEAFISKLNEDSGRLTAFFEDDNTKTKLSENNDRLFRDYSQSPQFAASNKLSKSNDEILHDCIQETKPLLQEEVADKFFGDPITQVFDSYIITKTNNSIMIIDQHAVHEKIIQEKMLNSLSPNNKQFLTKPEILDLTTSEQEMAANILDSLKESGFSVDKIKNTLMISAIPTVLNIQEAIDFIRDILSDPDAVGNLKVVDVIKRRIADKACHNSIRFGRKLSDQEMKALINQMEITPSIHQCNHHRPSFVELTKEQLQKLFDRS